MTKKVKELLDKKGYKKLTDVPLGSKISIYWDDHYEIYEDLSFNDIKDRCKNTYLGDWTGHLVWVGSRMVCLAGNFWEDDKHYDGAKMFVMRRAIADWEVLKVAKNNKITQR